MASDIQLPDLAILSDGGPPDIQLWAKSWPIGLDETADVALWYAAPDQGSGSRIRVFSLAGGEFFLIRYLDGTDFLIHRSGSKVWCRWPSQFAFDYAATYLYGPILGFLLRLKGVVCLHASVVDIGGWAVGFLGPQKAGKSTLAAYLGRRGFSILADDILALKESAGVFHAIPAYPRIRLWPESVSALFGSPEALPRITASWDKRHLDLTSDNYRFETHHRPVGAIYVLGGRIDQYPGQRVEGLEGGDGLYSLIANTYAYKTFDKAMRAYEFTLLSRLASRVSLRRLVPFSDLAAIERLCDLVLSDFQTIPRPNTGTAEAHALHLHV